MPKKRNRIGINHRVERADYAVENKHSYIIIA